MTPLAPQMTSALGDAPAETQQGPQAAPTASYDVLIIGAGTAGVSVAARLCKADRALRVAVIDPSADHYYQPLWTLVGGGEATREQTRRSTASLLPRQATLIARGATAFDPERRRVTTDDGAIYEYEQLVVAPGLRLDWERIEGLTADDVGEYGLVSNYSWDTVEATWPTIQAMSEGTALFTHPATPIKCGGAPMKVMFLACDHWRKRGVLDQIDVHFYIASPKIFAVEKYARTLLEVVERYGITVHYRHDLTAIDPVAKRATFTPLDGGEPLEHAYDMIHVTPPMAPPRFIAESPLADAAGWVDVDKHTCQHTRYPEVFALGDASNLPTSKTGAAIRKQAPVVARNLLALRRGEPLPGSYDGYTSCPLVTGYGKLVLAEFGYDKQPLETFPIDQGKERWSMYQLKKHLLPLLYWHGMLRGRA